MALVKHSIKCAYPNWNKENIEVGDFLYTGGVHYAPYNMIKCVWIGENALVAHIKGHSQYWGRSQHYIPAHLIVFQKVDENEYGNWVVKNVWEKNSGRFFHKVKAEAIAYAKTL